MGKERDELIKNLGETPVSEDAELSNEELMKERMAHYARKGRLPPEIEALRRKEAQEKKKKSGDGDDE